MKVVEVRILNWVTTATDCSGRTINHMVHVHNKVFYCCLSIHTSVWVWFYPSRPQTSLPSLPPGILILHASGQFVGALGSKNEQ